MSIYRDGSKRTQPLNTSQTKEAEVSDHPQPVRRKLPDERQAITHKFDIAGHEGYITVGLFEDRTPGEIFLVMAKEGSTISGFADAFAQAVSYALQYGVPLQVLVDKFSHVRFEPSGLTKNPDVRLAKSIVDYVFRWMATKFLSEAAQYQAGVNVRDAAGSAESEASSTPEAEQLTLNSAGIETAGTRGGSSRRPDSGMTVPFAIQNDHDAPPCSTCGAIMIRKRRLLQVCQLWRDEWVRLDALTWLVDPDRTPNRSTPIPRAALRWSREPAEVRGQRGRIDG